MGSFSPAIMPKGREVCRTCVRLSKLTVVPAPNFKDHFLNPRNVGSIDHPEAAGEAASPLCGALVRFTLRIDDEKRIEEARFKAIGCGLLVGTASLLTEEVRGKTIAECAQRARTEDANQCAALCRDALLAAIARYSDSVREEWVGDEALICSCFGVSERVIEAEIGAGSLRTIAEVTHVCRAGAGCRSCYPLIQDILDVHWREQM